jgi:hypothetical protein
MAILILNRSTNHKRPFGQNGSNWQQSIYIVLFIPPGSQIRLRLK